MVNKKCVWGGEAVCERITIKVPLYTHNQKIYNTKSVENLFQIMMIILIINNDHNVQADDDNDIYDNIDILGNY